MPLRVLREQKKMLSPPLAPLRGQSTHCPYNLSSLKLQRLLICLKPVKFGSRLAHNAGPQMLRKLPHREIGRVTIPVGVIARKHQHLIGRKHLQHRMKVVRVWRLLQRLRSQPNVSRRHFAGQFLQPGDRRVQRLPILVQAPQDRGQPGNSPFDQYKLEIGKLGEHPLRQHTRHMSNVTVHQRRMPLEIAGGIAGRVRFP